MTQAPQFEAEVTDPVFPVTFRAFSEGIFGHGVLGVDGLAVTAGAGDFEIDVGTGTVQYGGQQYENAAAETLTISQPAAEPRWDIVYFDTGTTSAGVKEGAPSPTPIPEDIGAGEVLLAYLEVGPEASNITGEDIREWRARPQPATNVPVDHADVDAATVHEALTWLVSNLAPTPHGNDDHEPNFSVDGHDHSGEAISPAEATVDSAPSSDTDVVRKTELDGVSTALADTTSRVDTAESEIDELQGQVGIETRQVAERAALPDPTGLTSPMIAYIDEEDRYAGVFQG